ncbi:hypothetical protein BDV37DRAFT_256405 [Aspergillus pseudonomiae]|uniref:Uncharacterized protein n=1 Tax=Aspergillus pseudonomiae TaxID=1506151 RepID=A0A5N7D3D4_9EURO|nr:uncharacterized protein BDV37DRAFT_256405 [Aspergillus pseudonomiae]KAE8400931.1 hypothetical protein BDV37DRAFT_256405 [Aspergillus pseudonomiae]
MQTETCLTVIQFLELTLHTQTLIDQQLRLLDNAKVLVTPAYHASIMAMPPMKRCHVYCHKWSFGKMGGS